MVISPILECNIILGDGFKTYWTGASDVIFEGNTSFVGSRLPFTFTPPVVGKYIFEQKVIQHHFKLVMDSYI